ncbi:hypothetical protein V2G26_019332 [Clonostachys chloroleuca]
MQVPTRGDIGGFLGIDETQDFKVHLGGARLPSDYLLSFASARRFVTLYPYVGKAMTGPVLSDSFAWTEYSEPTQEWGSLGEASTRPVLIPKGVSFFVGKKLWPELGWQVGDKRNETPNGRVCLFFES